MPTRAAPECNAHAGGLSRGGRVRIESVTFGKKGVAVIIVTNRIPVAPGHQKAFEDRFRKRAHLIDRSPGFIKNLVMRPVQRRFNHESGAWEEREEQGYYLVQTYWESEQHFWHICLWVVRGGIVLHGSSIPLGFHLGVVF